jgi:hypothetical protein
VSHSPFAADPTGLPIIWKTRLRHPVSGACCDGSHALRNSSAGAAALDRAPADRHWPSVCRVVRMRRSSCQTRQWQMAHPLDEVTAPGQKMLRDDASDVSTLAGAARPSCGNSECSAFHYADYRKIMDPPRLRHRIGGGIVAMVRQKRPLDSTLDKEDRLGAQHGQ